jgi:hypothetical protein
MRASRALSLERHPAARSATDESTSLSKPAGAGDAFLMTLLLGVSHKRKVTHSCLTNTRIAQER